MARDDSPILYSTDGSHRRACPRCGKERCACVPAPAVVPTQTRLRLRLESKGRAGKSVTVLFDLPANEAWGAALLKTLKAHCGAGGALKPGTLELQGDQRDKVQRYLEGLGYRVTRSGG